MNAGSRTDAAAVGSKLANEQAKVLRHMLGIDTKDKKEPQSYRDYYCASKDDATLQRLEALGMVELYSRRDGYDWWRTTELGKEAARASQRAMMLPKRQRIYRAFLRVNDVMSGLSFREFLVSREFEQVRKDA